MRLKRSNSGSNNSVGLTDKGLTNDGSKQGLTKYPAVLYALADVGQRAKLRSICESLSNKGLLKHVRYGVSGPAMDIVSEYLTALK